MTTEEYKITNDQLYEVVRQRDNAEGRAIAWKCLAILLLIFVLLAAADRWGLVDL